jgi:Sec-independent protein translocase protein TatA
MDFLGTPTHILFLLAVVLLFFGSTRLPKLARSLREARDEFNRGSNETTGDKPAEPGPDKAG